jgi:hypothetical protein
MAKCYKWFSQISDYTERATKTSLWIQFSETYSKYMFYSQ